MDPIHQQRTEFEVYKAEVNGQVSEIQAGYNACSQAFMHHSIVLASLQKEIEELKKANLRKDKIIEEQEKARLEMVDSMKALEKRLEVMEQEIDEENDSVGEENEEDPTTLPNSKEQDLYYAAKSGCLSDVQALLSNGAAVDAEHESHYTALHAAADNGRSEVVEALIAHGANTEARGFGASTPLMLASIGGHLTALEVLVKGRANLEARDSLGHTALICASQRGRAEAVEALIANGANINSQTDTRDTALGAAVRFEQTKVVEILLRAGAILNSKASRRRSILQQAETRHWRPEIIQMLKAAGANQDPDLQSKTAFLRGNFKL